MGHAPKPDMSHSGDEVSGPAQGGAGGEARISTRVCMCEVTIQKGAEVKSIHGSNYVCR